MKLLFSLVILANSALLFWVELLYGKRILPVLGGSPAVWNTCLMFYQAVLLAGYAYGVVVTRLAPRAQVALHGTLLAAVVAGLPWFLFVWPDPGGHPPVLWVLGLLTLSVGAPLFLLAAGSLLLQRWFSLSSHPDRRDPYFLYAASNLGSFLGLAAYPLAFEPLLSLGSQVGAWKGAFAAVAVLVAAAGAWALASGRAELPGALPDPPGEGPAPRAALRDDAPALGRRLRWMGLAFLPSSLLLGVTTHITGEVAPVPLLWVVPLALYLLTFALAFGPARGGEGGGGRSASPPGAPVPAGGPGRARLTPRTLLLWGGGLGAALLLLLAAGPGAAGLRWLWVLAHLGMLVLAGVVCHVRLARDRPAPRHLAGFYLWIALGGALGGVFNGLLAPLLFSDPLEYPLALALLAFVVASGARDGKEGGRPSLRPGDLVLGALPAAAAWGLARWATGLGIDPLLLLAVPGGLVLLLAGRPYRFGLGVAGFVLVGFLHPVAGGDVIFRERSFFGIHRVYRDGGYHWLAHGTTVHGGQHRDRPGEPLTYYHPDGPAGDLLGPAADPSLRRVGVVGLGTGSLIAYARPGQIWTFLEIDPVVIEIAETPELFTYLADAGVPYRHLPGDARLTLARDEALYDLLVIDAFTSDAVPVHLLTVEAIRLYLTRLRPGGTLAFHISNRYLDLSRVLGEAAAATGLHAVVARDETADMARGHYPSHWVVLSHGAPPPRGPRWRPLPSSGIRPWTDSYSSLLPLLGR